MYTHGLIECILCNFRTCIFPRSCSKIKYFADRRVLKIRDSSSRTKLTSLVRKVHVEAVLLAHGVRVYSVKVQLLPVGLAVVLLQPRLAIAQVQVLVVQLVGGGVVREPHQVVLVAVVVVQDGGLADGHADDRVAVLVLAPGRGPPAVAVPALGPQQHRGDVVDLVRGLGAGTLLRHAAPLAPAVAGVEHQGEEKDEEEEGDQSPLRGKDKDGESVKETVEKSGI